MEVNACSRGHRRAAPKRARRASRPTLVVTRRSWVSDVRFSRCFHVEPGSTFLVTPGCDATAARTVRIVWLSCPNIQSTAAEPMLPVICRQLCSAYGCPTSYYSNSNAGSTVGSTAAACCYTVSPPFTFGHCLLLDTLSMGVPSCEAGVRSREGGGSQGCSM